MTNRGLARPRWFALGVGLAAMLMVFACGGDQGASTRSEDMAPPEQQVLRLRLVGEPKTIDPHLSNFASETTLTKPLFTGLFTYDENLKVVPGIASQMPTEENGGISRDGLTYTIKLEKDAKWSDGKAITANDFVYSLKRALDPKLAGPYVSFFYGISGAQDYNTALGTATAPKDPSEAELTALRDKVGVSAKDGNTVVYQLTTPNPSFLNQLALWTAFPVREDVVTTHGANWTEAENHVGNGAFVLREWAHDERIVFEPNPYWHGEKPALTRIVINFIADDAAAYAAYLAGDLDQVIVPPANRRDVLSPGSALNEQLVRIPDLNTFAVFMNNSAAPFDNQKVRQALGIAIDREAYVEGVLQGGGRPTTSWVPPGMPGFDASIGSENAYNPAKAKQLLSDAGFPEGRGLPKITFVAVANDSNRIAGQFIEDQLRLNLGIEVEHEYVDSRTRGARYTANDYQATIISWNADWPYPDNWLPDLFGSGALNNHTAWKSMKFDDLVRRAAAETDDEDRLALYGEAHKLVIDEAVIAPLYNRESFVLVKPHVKDLVITSLDGSIKGDYNFHKTYIVSH
ncbi:MAG: peptide ABC transporter substrate-binding protein [Dehalococcoidia bacterium]|nr:peptide ABC transporter substrate-binding protein [Dehalococcoidia bacterium]